MPYSVEVKYNCKYLFLYFNFFCNPATMKLTKAETLQFGSTTGQKLFYPGGCLILVWTSGISYYICNSTCHVM